MVATCGVQLVYHPRRLAHTPRSRPAPPRAADLSHGFNGVLPKPFSRDALREVMLAECAAPRRPGRGDSGRSGGSVVPL